MFIRRATEKDLKAIWEIWMQPHVIKYMSFDAMPLSEFKPVYERFNKNTQIYVMAETDSSGHEKVIAVRRLAFGEGERSHVVGFYSLGLHHDYLRKGYGEKFQAGLLDIVKQHPGIKRVELTQSEGNQAAFRLIEKFGFEVEVIFPKWLHEKLYERYMGLILDKSILKNIANAELDFVPAKKVHIYSHHPVPILYTLEPSPSVLKHIAFLNLSLEKNVELNHAADFMQDLAKQLSQKGFTKIEIFTHEPRVVKLLEILGYQYRGKKIASLKIGEHYYNELALDFDLTEK